MPDLETLISDWRRGLAGCGIRSQDTLDELECHLRDIIDEHAARRRLQESVELLQECRLPRSRVTGNGSQRALLDDGRDIAERLMLKRRAGHVDIRDMF